jgi:hypothetical protein
MEMGAKRIPKNEENSKRVDPKYYTGEPRSISE